MSIMHAYRTTSFLFSLTQEARDDKTKPTQWSYRLLSDVYSLWFMHLPAMIECYTTPRDILNYAYKILVQMNRQHLTNPDEVRKQNLIVTCDRFIDLDMLSCYCSTMWPI
jgi:hypothetical protein